MILFFDDEKPLAPPTGRRKYVRRFIKLVMILLVLLGISLWVLKSIGGNNNALKLGMQDYLTDTTGYIAQVDELLDMSFFPMSHLAFKDLTLHEMIEKQKPAAESEAAKAGADHEGQAFPYQKTATDFFDAGAEVASLEHVNVTLDFWDVFFSRRRFYDLDVQGLRIRDGVWGIRAFELTRLMIEDKNAAAIVGSGFYDKQSFSLRVNIEKDIDAAGRKRYRIPNETRVEMNWGALGVKGILDSSPGDDLRLKIEELTLGENSFSGDVSWGTGFKGSTLSANLEGAGIRFVLHLLTTPDKQTSGTLDIPVFDIARFADMKTVYHDAMSLLASGQSGIVFPHKGVPIHLALKVSDIKRQDSALGHLTAKMVVGQRILDVTDISGLLGGGALGGQIKIEGRNDQLHLAAQGKLRSWDYALHEGKAVAQLDIHASLQAQAASWGALLPALSGEMIIIADPARLVPAEMLYKTGDVLRTVRKGDEITPWGLNCGFADFEVESGKAVLQRAVMEGEGIVVQAEGSWILQSGIADISFMPYVGSEGEASVSAVTLRGKYPAIEAKQARSARPLADLPVNVPDFDRISTADIAMSLQHACRSYLGEQQP